MKNGKDAGSEVPAALKIPASCLKKLRKHLDGYD
jgi:hypothetical protein